MADDAACANPQLLAWVKEWLDVARERNSKGVAAYRTAYESLRACPLAFSHPAELQQLKGFGPKLCERLTAQLQAHCRRHGQPMPEHPQARHAAADDDDAAAADRRRRPARKPRAYVPTFRSGAYGLVIGLASLPEDSAAGLTKAELIEAAQPHCDASFTAPSDPTKFYTAWNSIKTLLQKELVYERGRPLRRYILTDEGWDVARRVKGTPEWQSGTTAAAHPPAPVRPPDPEPGLAPPRSPSPGTDEAPPPPVAQPLPYRDVVAEGPPPAAGDASLPNFAPIRLPPGSFTVHLVLDFREVRAKTDRDYMQDELAKQGARPIMRSLEVGDAQWIAKLRDPGLLARHGAEGDEVVLDWIVERKRLDDLISSITDGRFHEQKFRLGRSGVKRVVYIIEEISMDHATHQRYEEMVQSAIASTQVVNGYFVKRTAKMDDTIKYMARLTAMLKRDYEGKTLSVIPTKVLTAHNYLPLLDSLRQREPSAGYYITYPAFASLASKSDMMTLRDVFLKMLMTTRGVTGERALAIQKRWKTPLAFVKAFEACGPGELGKKRKRELVSTELHHLAGRTKISKQLSQKIAEVWGDA